MSSLLDKADMEMQPQYHNMLLCMKPQALLYGYQSFPFNMRIKITYTLRFAFDVIISSIIAIHSSRFIKILVLCVGE